MRRIFKHIHLWLSVPFGLVITITCFTGAMLVFEKEVTALCIRDMTAIEPAGAPLSMDVLAEKVAATLNEDVSVTGVVVSADPSVAYKVNLSKPKHAAVYINQYTGEIKGLYNRLEFFRVMRYMHRWLMDTSRYDDGIFWGRIIVGTSTLAFVVILLSGFVVWWPRNRKSLANRLKIVVSKGWNRLWYDLHVAGGFYALLLLLVMALTGLTWSFEWYKEGFYKVFGVEAVANRSQANTNAGKERKNAPTDDKQSPYMHWQSAYDEVVALNPRYRQMTVSAGRVSIAKGGFGNERASDIYSFDSKTGEITDVVLYADATPQSKMNGWIYTLHVGSWGGLFMRIIYFLVALLGATLPLTGYYLWIKRLFRKRH